MTEKLYTHQELSDIVNRPDNPGTVLLSAVDFDQYSELFRDVIRTPEGVCFFHFMGTRFEREIRSGPKLDLTQDIHDASDPVEIPCETPDAEWHGHESPLVSPPVPQVRKG